MKNDLFFLLWLSFISTCVFGEDSLQKNVSVEEIAYEWLVSEAAVHGYTDHVPHFKEIFQRQKIKGMLEFGLGFSTKYFLDNCDKVISVEFVTEGSGPDWMKKMLQLYNDYVNWVPIAYFSHWPSDMSWAPFKYHGSEHVYNACSYQCATHRNYAEIDPFYLKELDAFISNLCRCHPISLAFVDSSIFLRGDLVTQLFNKVPIIVAHDTASRILGVGGDIYGYSRIVTPPDYEEIGISEGQGTTIWIQKTEAYQQLINAIKQYAIK